MMYVSLIILTPLFFILWVYLIIVVKNSLSTSIELNIIHTKKVIAKSDVTMKRKNKYHVPKFMLELYESNKASKNFTSPDVVRSLIPKHAEALSEDFYQPPSNSHILVFNLPKTDDDETFVAAELRILTILDYSHQNNIFGVEKKIRISIFNDDTNSVTDLEEIQIQHFNNSWLSFDVTRPVFKELQKSSILKIVVTIKDLLPQRAAGFKLSLLPNLEDSEHDYPILLLCYSSASKAKNTTRAKRSVEEDYEEETNIIWDEEQMKSKSQMRKIKRIRHTCRRKPLYINFAEIDYDIWIVQPSGYEAYQCQGRCFYPVAEHLNPTKHAIMQSLVHSVSPSRAARSCCVPTSLDSISILYVDGNGVLTYRFAYKDMVVVECGCR